NILQYLAHALGNRLDFLCRDALHGADHEQPLRSVEFNRVHASSSHGASTVASVSLHAAKYRSSRTQQLQSVLEKSVFERWLKSARLRLADPESWADFELRRAINFHVCPAASLERCANRVYSERGRVAIAAEVPKPHVLDFSV